MNPRLSDDRPLLLVLETSLRNQRRNCESERAHKSSWPNVSTGTFYGRDIIAAMENTPDLIGRIVYLPGGVKVRVEAIFEDDDQPRARTRRVGGPHDGIEAFIEVWKLGPCEETDQR